MTYVYVISSRLKRKLLNTQGASGYLVTGISYIITAFNEHNHCLGDDLLYRVSHKKWNGGFSVACDLKVPYLFTSSTQATPAEVNDTKIIKFD